MSAERNRALIGHRFAVLVEGPARRGGGMLAGKTPQFKTAVFAAADSIRPGDIGDGARGIRDRAHAALRAGVAFERIRRSIRFRVYMDSV